MMPSTALCYDDYVPFFFVNCRMCVIKVGSFRTESQRKSINFINTAFYFFMQTARVFFVGSSHLCFHCLLRRLLLYTFVKHGIENFFIALFPPSMLILKDVLLKEVGSNVVM
jgi:hypothetical protein